MRIESNRGIAITRDYRREASTEQGTGTSLVPVGNTAPRESRQYRTPRTLATFVTQLIAKEQHAAHTRIRCRAEPAEAAEAYRKMLKIGGVPNRYKARPF
jgi:hypothetical protein